MSENGYFNVLAVFPCDFGYIPIGQRQIALLDSSKSIKIISISSAATVYLMSTLFKIARLIIYTVCSLGNWKL